MRSALCWIVLSALVVAATATPVAGQETAAIGGRVTTTDDLPLAGVAVSVVRIGSATTAASTTTRTGHDGRYAVTGLAPGTYRVTFTLAGYRTTSRTDVRAFGGPTVADATLVPWARLADTFDREALEQIPTARDPWVVMTLTPSVVLDGRVNVGGSASGQQLVPHARGQGLSNVTWVLNGAVVTDMSAEGASPMYYDFDSLQAERVTTGAADVSVQTAGVNISLVTRAGTDRFRGSVRGWFSGGRIQSRNVTPDLFAQGSGAGVPLRGYADYGTEAGGPIVAGRLWWWAGAGDQDINRTSLRFYRQTPGCSPPPQTFDAIDAIAECLYPDKTWIRSANSTVTIRPAASQTVHLSMGYEDKGRNVRDASATTALDLTARQHGGMPVLSLRHEWLAGQRVAVETVGGYLPQTFDLDYAASSRRNRRPASSIQSTAAAFLPKLAGAAQTLKFGFGYRRSLSTTYLDTADLVVYQPSAGYPGFVELYREEVSSVLLHAANGFVQDSLRRGRLSIDAGVRVDRQDDSAPAASLPANPLRPDLLPAAHFDGFNPSVDFTDVAPRVSAAYTLFDRHPIVVSGSYGVYFAQGVGLAQLQNATDRAYADAQWTDANHDGVIQANEVTGFSIRDVFLDPTTGLIRRTDAPADPHLRNYRTREWTARVDHQLSASWSVGATYIGRIYDRDRWTCCGPPSSAYAPFDWTDYRSGLSSTFYLLTRYDSAALNPAVTTNRPGRSSDYRGLELALHKRLAHRWSFDATLTRQKSIAHWPPGSYGDPTGIANLDGQPDDAALPRYIFRTHGTMGLPWRLHASAVLNVQGGLIRQLIMNGPLSFDGPIGPPTLTVDPFGSDRYRPIRLLDAQFDKELTFGAHKRRVVVSAVVFNVLNASTPTLLANNVSRADFGQILDMVGPRVLRIGATVHF